MRIGVRELGCRLARKKAGCVMGSTAKGKSHKSTTHGNDLVKVTIQQVIDRWTGDIGDLNRELKGIATELQSLHHTAQRLPFSDNRHGDLCQMRERIATVNNRLAFSMASVNRLIEAEEV